jgi:hypothetical protein
MDRSRTVGPKPKQCRDDRCRGLAAPEPSFARAATADDLQEILRRMCRSLADPQGNLLRDFLFCIGPKERDKVHRRFMKLLFDELMEQHDYQHEHQGEQGPPTGRFVGVKGPPPK